MTVKQLINKLKEFDEDKIVVLTEPDFIGWDNIGMVIEEDSIIKISFDGGRQD